MTQPNATSNGGFDLNRPTIINLLYISSFFVGLTGIIGVVLAYVWKGEPGEAWEQSHYSYLANTFWIGLAGSVLGFLLLIVLVGFLIWIATAVLVIVRIIMSMIAAQKREPMPNPGTFVW